MAIEEKIMKILKPALLAATLGFFSLPALAVPMTGDFAPVEPGLHESVVEVEVPLNVLAEGAVADLSDLAGLVATTDLIPGEQIIAIRLRMKAPVDEVIGRLLEVVERTDLSQ